jgi:heat shock protein HslJ
VGRIRAAVVIAIAVLLAACTGSIPSLPPGPGPALDGREFLSTAVTVDGAPHDLVPDTRISLAFEDGGLRASAGCNLFGAPYRVDGDRLVTAGGAMTEMGCDGPRHAQDDWLFTLLGSGPTVAVTGDELVLTAGTTVISLLDREVAQPDRPLIGTTWQVESIVTGDAVSSVPGQVVATLRFTADGQVLVDTGCNTGGGPVEVRPETIRFGEIMITASSCEAPFGELEQPMLQVLQAGEVGYRIDADSLTLNANGHGLQLRAS